MARRPIRSVTGLLAVLVALAGCSAIDAEPEAIESTAPPSSSTATTPAKPTTTTSASTTTSTSTTTTTTAPTSTIATSTTTTTTLPPTTTTSTSVPLPEIEAEVTVPPGNGPFPAVVLAHGGGWVAGGPLLMRPLSEHLNRAGFMTVNSRYQLATLDRAGFPDAVEDVACAVRYAAAHPESDGTVAVIGHSAGAHLGALVALTGDDYVGDCPVDGSAIPDRFVGLAGPYDISRLGLVMLVFFGEGPNLDPEAWENGNPQLQTDENPGLNSLIMYGDQDGIVDDVFAIDFHNALLDSGSESVLELVEGAQHNDMDDPDVVGDLIVTWLER